MSATICWRPADTNPKHLSVGAPSSFQEAMRRAGLKLPCIISQTDKDVLRGLAAAWDRDAPNPYQQILDLLEHHDAIELWAEY